MKLLIPPPIIVALCVGLMWLLARLLPIDALAFAPQPTVTVILLVVAAALMSIAAWQFARAHTTINPMRPANASSLVTGGVFAYSRNPIYLADLIVLFAATFWFGQLAGFAVCALFVVTMNRLQIAAEESALAARFGDDYDTYRRRVRRWI